jgi:hypothetical protein
LNDPIGIVIRLRPPLLVCALFVAATTSQRLHAQNQPRSLMVTVIDSLSRQLLPNADVAALTARETRITDDLGRAYLTWPSSGKIQLRVRQIGYQPREIAVERASSGNSITIALSKVAYVLADVRATSRCSTQVDTTRLGFSATALGQLKQAAEKYNEFRRSFPFEASVERRTAAVPPSGDIKRIVVSQEKVGSEKFDARYRPGNVIEYRFGEFTVPILMISTLADSVFWDHHCFVARGFESYQGNRVIRLEFVPTADVDGPDYKGAALLDSATSMLLRVEFHLANPPRRSIPTKLDGYTTFVSPSPFVVLPDTTGAMWWLRKPGKDDWGKPDYMQLLFMTEVSYRKGKPPSYAQP